MHTMYFDHIQPHTSPALPRFAPPQLFLDSPLPLRYLLGLYPRYFVKCLWIAVCAVKCTHDHGAGKAG